MLGRTVEPDDSSFGRAMDVFAERWNQLPEGRRQDNPGVDYTQQPPGPGVRSGASVSRGQADVLEAEMNQRGPGLLYEISNRGRRMAFNPAVEEAIREASRRAGVPLSTMRAFATVESGGNPKAQTGSYLGLFQLSRDEFKRYGGSGNIFDPVANATAAANKFRVETGMFTQRYGRPPTTADLYMIHQQGWGGYQAHARNPEAPAWQNMASTAEGRQKGPAWAKKAIWGNLPEAARRQFGSVDNVTSAGFMQWWNGRIARAGGTPDPLSSAPQTAQAPVGRTTPVPPPMSQPGVGPSMPQAQAGPGMAGGMGPNMVPISPVAEAPTVTPMPPPQPQAGKAPDQALYRSGGGGGLPGWATEAFSRGGDQPVDPVQARGTLANLLGPVPPPVPSTDAFLQGQDPNRPLRGLLGTGGRSGIFSGIFSGGGFFGGGGF